MEALDTLKTRLLQLEQSLKRIAETMDSDLNIGRELQKVLMPNRTPEIPGLKTHARYISAQQIASESFDLIPTKDGKELWTIVAWTESFGLSSVLLQALVHIQSRAIVQARPLVTPAEIFDEISTSMTGARKAGAYRLMVSRLNVASLEMSGVSMGMPPWMRRTRNAAGYSPLEFVQSEAFASDPSLLDPCSSAAPRLATEAYHFAFTLAPGNRLHFLTSAWAGHLPLAARLKNLESDKLDANADLLGEMNHLLIHAGHQLKKSGREADISALAFEVDAKKLHLA
ncbi:MAG: hypothetical protein JST16_12690 [Bdellovibrionales bacterium]|nr:hypothetical protein [Bdellovibrionales bacterium]